MHKQIDIYHNGIYLCSTDKAETCKEACQGIRDKIKNGILMIGIKIAPDDFITAEFSPKQKA